MHIIIHESKAAVKAFFKNPPEGRTSAAQGGCLGSAHQGADQIGVGGGVGQGQVGNQKGLAVE